MKIKELKELLNKTNTIFDDCEISFFHEEEGGGSKTYGGYFDAFTIRGGKVVFAITTCETEEDYKWHDKEVSWDEIDKINY